MHALKLEHICYSLSCPVTVVGIVDLSCRKSALMSDIACKERLIRKRNKFMTNNVHWPDNLEIFEPDREYS